MSLYKNLNEDLKKYMKLKDKDKINAIRSIIAAVKNFKTSSSKAKNQEITDEIITDLALREAKKREEAILAYEKLDRDELVEHEKNELEIIKSYLPKSLSNEEISKIALETIQETGAKGPSDLGVVMKALISKTKGRADGKMVNKIVREMLAGL